MSWVLVWKAVTILTVAAFSVLTGLVLLGGGRNVAQMLKDLRRSHD